MRWSIKTPTKQHPIIRQDRLHTSRCIQTSDSYTFYVFERILVVFHGSVSSQSALARSRERSDSTGRIMTTQLMGSFLVRLISNTISLRISMETPCSSRLNFQMPCPFRLASRRTLHGNHFIFRRTTYHTCLIRIGHDRPIPIA